MPNQPVDLRKQIEAMLDAHVRPYLQSHGGDIALVSIDDRPDGAAVAVAFQAACRNCDLREVTFAATVRERLRSIPAVHSVTCTHVSLSNDRLDRIARFFA